MHVSTTFDTYCTSYRVIRSECYRVPEHVDPSFNLSRRYSADSNYEDVAEEPRSAESFNEITGLVPVPLHLPSPFAPVVPDELATPPDPQEVDTSSDFELSQPWRELLLTPLGWSSYRS